MKNASGLVAALVVVSAVSASAGVAKFDPRIAADRSQAETNGLEWVDGRALPLESRGFADTERPFDRLPADLADRYSPGVRAMMHHATGHYFLFVTDSDVLAVEWELENKSEPDPFIPSQGQYGVDIYRHDEKTGWRFVKNGRLSAPNEPVNRTSVNLPSGMTPVMVYLPTRGVVRAIRIGLKPGARLERYVRPSGVVLPVVHYGTSIVHGGCASRPGLCFANQAARQADVPYVNLGFSGCAKLELVMAEAMARVDASLYIVDTVWNCGPTAVFERFKPFVRKLHELRPDVPILVCEGGEPAGARLESNVVLKRMYDELKSEGGSLAAWLHYLPAEGLIPNDGESTHDYCHPNDYGSMQMGRIFAQAIREAIRCPSSGDPSLVASATERVKLPVYHGGRAWNSGYRPSKTVAWECAARNALVTDSVKVVGADGTALRRDVDFKVEPTWGAVGLLAGAATRTNETMTVSYDYRRLRIDSTVLLTNGVTAVRRGVPDVNMPNPPALASGETLVGNVLVSPDGAVRYPVLEPPERTPRTASGAETCTPKTLDKLRRGEPVTILAWGDSVTACGFLPDADRWQDVFVRRLRERFPKSPITLVSNGWGARATRDFLAAPEGSVHNYSNTVLNAKADLVVSEFVNDCGLPDAERETIYRRLLREFRAAGKEWVILTPHYVCPPWMGLKSSRNCDDDQRPYVKFLRAFAAANRVGLADASLRWGHLWREGIPYETMFVNNVNHPNALGMSFFADALMDFFGCPDPSAVAVVGVSPRPVRKVVNIVNFVRALDPRSPKPVFVKALDEEVELNRKYGFPNTILLQYDALVDPEMLATARKSDPEKTEFGFWFEMSRPLNEAAGIEWKPDERHKGWDWDWFINPGFLMAYDHDGRRKLIDAAFAKFRETFGHYPKSVGSWLLDAYSMDYMVGKYGVDGFCICREQDNTDAYGLRGGYSNGAYYPSKKNMLSAAVDMRNAVRAPVFKMLTPDPIYNYGCPTKHYPDYPFQQGCPTMEPSWPSGFEPRIVDWFFRVYTEPKGLMNLSYMQVGQENSFGWESISKGLPYQYAKIAAAAADGRVAVETMGETARRFKADHPTNCSQTQVALEDWNDNRRKSVWYNSRFYRANLMLENGRLVFRDIHKMADDFEEPFLNSTCKGWQALYFTPPIVDQWLFRGVDSSGAMALSGDYTSLMAEAGEGDSLVVTAIRADGVKTIVRFEEGRILIEGCELLAEYEGVFRKDIRVEKDGIGFMFCGCRYWMSVSGLVIPTETGFRIGGKMITLDFSATLCD